MSDENKKTIMVVDDEPDLRELIQFMFNTYGYNVKTASNGREAFDLYQNNKIDMIFSDVRMAKGDGIELLERLRALDEKLPPFIFTTGFADITVDRARQKGAAGVIEKPYDLIEDLLKTVKQHLGAD